MAISVTKLTNGEKTSASTDTIVTASISPSSNALLLLCVASTDYYIASVTGLSLTWELVATKYDGNNFWLSIFRAKTGTSPGSGAITGTFNSNSDGAWTVLEVTGVDISGTAGSTAIVQSASNNVTGTSLTVTLGAFSSASYATLGILGKSATSLTTPGTGFTEVSDVASTYYNIETEYKTANDTTVDWSWTGSAGASGIAMEMKITGVSPSSSTSPSASMSPSVSPSASSSPSASVSPSVSPSASVSPSSSSSRSVSPSSSVSPSASVSPSVSPSASVSPSSSSSRSVSPSASVSPSSSNSPSPSVGNSYSMSPSSSISPSVSPSSSVSPSVSASISPSASTSPSPSVSASLSPSSSLSPSASSSLSPSLSPSASQSRSTSPSHSASPSSSASLSKSPSPSPSPEPSHNLFTREAIVGLPSGKADLAIVYTTPEEGKVAVEDGHRVAVSGATAYLVHQFKRRHTNRSDRIKIRINARTTLAPTTETVYLQIWNGITNSWETLDSNNKSGANVDFNLHGDVSDTSYYDFQNEVCVRIYQNNPII